MIGMENKLLNRLLIVVWCSITFSLGIFCGHTWQSHSVTKALKTSQFPDYKVHNKQQLSPRSFEYYDIINPENSKSFLSADEK